MDTVRADPPQDHPVAGSTAPAVPPARVRAAQFAALVRQAQAAQASGEGDVALATLSEGLEVLRLLRSEAAMDPPSEARARLLALCDYFTGELRALTRSPGRDRLAALAAVAAMLRGVPRL